MNLIAFRNLVDVAYTADEVKTLAEEYEYPDDPDEEGNPVLRQGKLSDYFPRPYPNDEAAKFANNGGFVGRALIRKDTLVSDVSNNILTFTELSCVIFRTSIQTPTLGKASMCSW